MIAIVDYGMGNLRSVEKAVEYVGGVATITSQVAMLETAQGVILPGVGAFGDAMANLRARQLIEPLVDQISSGKPFLGICLGMHLLFEVGEEMGRHEGLGFWPDGWCDSGMAVSRYHTSAGTSCMSSSRAQYSRGWQMAAMLTSSIPTMRSPGMRRSWLPQPNTAWSTPRLWGRGTSSAHSFIRKRARTQASGSYGTSWAS